MNHRFPWFLFEVRLHWFYKHLVFNRKLKKYGKGSFLSPFSEVINMSCISIGERVTILHGAWIIAIEEYAGQKYDPQITIGDSTYIGHNVTLSCVNRIDIGRDVTFGDNVYIADNAHSYEDISRNIYTQELRPGKIVIGDRAWVGKNAVITNDVEIGEHAIVGANSFVNRSVPPYTIVVGNPARPVKAYDFEQQKWVSLPGGSIDRK
jgi:acetyltransferase-like isoleucine patch superfamily enzyme